MLKKQERLQGVKKALADVVLLACTFVSFDVQLVEGVRTQARQNELYAQGRTPGDKRPIVTWTKTSKHITGDAVDIVPLQADGSINWNDTAKFNQLASAMQAAAAQLKTKIRWGADWDGDGKPREKGEQDSPHWEL